LLINDLQAIISKYFQQMLRLDILTIFKQ